jgi:glycosyltransferase involved in cell wall biosynthesis
MRCAIVHYWLLGMRGGEKVVEALCRLFPNADIFTLFYDPERISPIIRSHRVKASFLNPFRRYYRGLLPLMPVALESFDLRDYDLVISSESGPAKGVILSSNTPHICYCHSPMRYLWDLYPSYLHEWTNSGLKRSAISLFANHLRLWDYASAARVDHFVANSANVQRRIWKTYRRTSDIIYPPVDVDGFYFAPSDDYYLVVSELVAYKRIADAIRCFSQTNRRLKVVGSGPEYTRLRSMAGPTVEFCGRVEALELRDLYAHCRAVIMPGEEDFGIVPVDALASGKPVIALGRGGVLETATADSPRSGFFYKRPGPDTLNAAIESFEGCEAKLSARDIQRLATHFSEERFRRELSELIDRGITSGTSLQHDGSASAITRSLPGREEGTFYNTFTASARQ